ncbi:hypothetical protein [Bacillus paranthracis]|uniref:hypothetical protein n=1 Tax=Bacillus paranthracis TaxID=2026186 RepID=UPI002E234619|nr:hypothetical protein [Bacillus paranthracis]
MSLWSVAGNVFIICLIIIMILLAVLFSTYIVVCIKEAVDVHLRNKKILDENEEKICLKK